MQSVDAEGKNLIECYARLLERSYQIMVVPGRTFVEASALLRRLKRRSSRLHFVCFILSYICDTANGHSANETDPFTSLF